MESIDPAITELNRLCRIAKLFRGDDTTYVENIHEPMMGLLHDAPYLWRTAAMSGYVAQEYERIVRLQQEKLI